VSCRDTLVTFDITARVRPESTNANLIANLAQMTKATFRDKVALVDKLLPAFCGSYGLRNHNLLSLLLQAITRQGAHC